MGVKFSGSGRAVLLFVLALFLSWQTAVAQGGPTIEIDGDDPLTASWPVLSDPGEIVFTLFNLTTGDIDVSYRLDELHTADGLPLDPAPDLPPQSDTLPAASGQSYAVSLAILGGLHAGSYSATLIVSDLSNDFVALRDVVLTVVDPAAPSKKKPQPLQDSWTSRADRWVMLLPQPLLMRSDVLPLDVPYQGGEEGAPVDLDLPQDVELGKLVNENGRIASVSWNGVVVEADRDLAGIELSFDGLDAIGAYEGDITLPGPDGEETVALTANVTTLIIWPILFIIFAIIIAILFRRWLDKGRKLDQLRFRLRDLVERRWPQNLAEFKDIGYPPPASGRAASLPCPLDEITYMAYDMSGSLEKNAQQMLGSEPGYAGQSVADLNKLTQFELAEDNESYIKLQADIAALEEAAGSWPAFGHSLVALDKALRGMSKKLADAKEDRESDPAFITQACGYLKGDSDLSVAAYDGLPAAVDEAAALVKEWPKLVESLEGHRQIVAKIEAAPGYPKDGDEKRMAMVKADLAAVDGLLWLEPDVAEIVAGTEKHMREAEAQLRTLQRKYLPRAASALESGGAKGLAGALQAMLVPGAWANLLAPVTAVQSAAAEREAEPETAAQIRGRMRFYDGLIFLVTAVLTVYAGLELRYFDKNFGTIWDFIFLLTLGLAGGIAVDTLIKYLGNYLNAGVPGE